MVGKLDTRPTINTVIAWRANTKVFCIVAAEAMADVNRSGGRETTGKSDSDSVTSGQPLSLTTRKGTGDGNRTEVRVQISLSFGPGSSRAWGPAVLSEHRHSSANEDAIAPE